MRTRVLVAALAATASLAACGGEEPSPSSGAQGPEAANRKALVVGINVNGSRRWLGYGPVRMQVSEFAKLGLVFCLAHYLALDDATLAVMRRSERDVLLLVLCTQASGRVDVGQWRAVPPDKIWRIVLTTEEPRFVESQDASLRADVAIDLQDGFKNDTVVIRADGRELRRDEAVSTRFQIGKAKSATLALPEGDVTLEVEVPTRNQRATVPIDTSKPTFVGISLTTEGRLEVRVQEQPFGYM